MKFGTRVVPLLFVFVMLFGVVNAGLGEYDPNTCVELRTISNSSAVTLSTVTDPLGSTEIINSAMTQNGKTFNYTYCKTWEIGNYVYDFYDTEGNSFVNDFDIGNENYAYYFIVLILSLGLIVFGMFIRDAPITIIGSFGLVLLGLYILFTGIAGVKDPVYTWGIGILMISTAMYIMTRSSFELVTSAD